MLRHTLEILFNRKLDHIEELFLHRSIMSFAVSMIDIFIPIYLIKINYSLAAVFLFFAMVSGTEVLVAPLAGKVSSKFGFKHSILFSTPFLICFYILLFSLKTYFWPLGLIAIILGISRILYWVGFHTCFAKFSNRNHRAEEVGFTRVLTHAFAVLGPLAGGLIIVFIGFKLLFILVCLILILSLIPLFFSKDVYEPATFQLRKVFRKKGIKNSLGFIGYGITGAVHMQVWPIFVFFAIVDNYAVLGSITSVSLLASFIFTLVISRFSDIKRKLVLRLGAVFNVLFWIIKLFIQTTLQVFIIDPFHYMARTAAEIPMDALSYDRENKNYGIEFTVLREITIHLGRVILFIAMMFIADLTISFILGSAASFLLFLF